MHTNGVQTACSKMVAKKGPVSLCRPAVLVFASGPRFLIKTGPLEFHCLGSNPCPSTYKTCDEAELPGCLSLLGPQSQKAIDRWLVKTLISHTSEAEKIRCPEIRCLARARFLVPVSLHGEGVSGTSIRTLIPSREPHLHDLIASQRPTSEHHYTEVRFQRLNYWAGDPFSLQH